MNKIILIVVMIVMGAVAIFAQDVTLSEDGLTATYTQQSTVGLQPVTRSGNTYIVGNQLMKPKAYTEYLSKTCTPAYVQCQTGRNLSNAGWGFLAGGLALQVTSYAMWGAVPISEHVGPRNEWTHAIWMTGNAFCAASIPLLVVGYCKQHNSVNTYNNQCARSQAYVTLNMSNNGLGLAYNF